MMVSDEKLRRILCQWDVGRLQGIGSAVTSALREVGPACIYRSGSIRKRARAVPTRPGAYEACSSAAGRAGG